MIKQERIWGTNHGGPRDGSCAACGRKIHSYDSYWGNRHTGAMFCIAWRPDDPDGGKDCVQAAYKHAIEQAKTPIVEREPNEDDAINNGLFYYTDG